MASKELAQRDESLELAILGEGEYAVPVEDADATSKRIVQQILGAETVDEVLDGSGTYGARDLLGVPFTISGVEWHPSQIEGEGPKVFALIHAVRMDDGDEALITCGSRNVMAQLYRMALLGELPNEVPMKLRENKTSSGTGALWLEKA